ncbi:hypothetical protein EPO56_02365 [Patescibacteria group bacterium]|nr:MAG: hypothetical protein EPO56_02365 [Patescibacteria group bacterium]
MKKYFIVFIAVFLVAGLWYAFTVRSVDAPIESQVSEVPTYVNASADDIVVTTPTPGSDTQVPIMIKGQARGMWYFEASFPIRILDSNGLVIGQGIATAEGDWMTESFVPFTASIALTSAYTGIATLVLDKDNPSGDAIRDASVSLPININ